MLVVFLATVPYRLMPKKYFKIEIVLIYVDLINQLMVCYICYTMGSSVKLRHYNCTYVLNKAGRLSLKF